MSNEYYNNDVKITPFTKASSADVDADLDAIATGFDKLPEPHASAPVTKGFAEVFEIVDGTDEAHPAPISQIRDAVFYGTDSGAANAYAVTLTPAPSAYTTGMTILFKPSASNTGASTVNVNSLGARNIKSTFGADPGANEIYASNYALMTYDGTNFILLNPAGSATTGVVTTSDVDDTPVNGVTTAPISSNWAYDHVAAADPHTGYVREADVDDTPVNGVTDAPISSNWAYDHVAAANPHPEFSGLLASFSLYPAALAIGTGAKTFSTGVLGKAFFAGMKVTAARQVDPTNYWMYGSVTSYDPDTGELVMNSELFKGPGSFSDWHIYASGEVPAPGVGQTWTNVTASRSPGTDYTNSTGKPIQVMVTLHGDGTGSLLIGGITVATTTLGGVGDSVLEAIIPNGMVYRVDVTLLVVSIWAELR